MKWKKSGGARGEHEADGTARQRDLDDRLARMMAYGGDDPMCRDLAENMRAVDSYIKACERSLREHDMTIAANYRAWGPVRRFLLFRCTRFGRAWYRDARERGVIAPWWSRSHAAR